MRPHSSSHWALGIAGMIGPAASVGMSEIARNSKTESNSIVSAFISVALTIVGATTVLAEMRGAFICIWSSSRSDVIGITSHTSVTGSSVSTRKNKAVWDFIRAEPYRWQCWSH